MKHFSAKLFFVIFIMTAVMPFFVFAQSQLDSSFEKLLLNLINQLQAIQRQLNQLEKESPAPPPVAKTEIKEVVVLKQGMRGPAVRELQEKLAKHPDIYPEGLITGYFGPKTDRALKRFQEKYELDVTGVTDDATIIQLNKITITSMMSASAASAVPATFATPETLAFGRGQSAPPKPGLPFGTILPGGDPNDIIPPKIYDIKITNIDDRQVNIAWKTNEPATTWVESALDSNSSTSFTSGNLDDRKYVLDHSINYNHPRTWKPYYLRVKSWDVNGNLTISDPQQHNAPAARQPPPISKADYAVEWPDRTTACIKAGGVPDGSVSGCYYQCPSGFVYTDTDPRTTGSTGYWYGCTLPRDIIKDSNFPYPIHGNTCWNKEGITFMCPWFVPRVEGVTMSSASGNSVTLTALATPATSASASLTIEKNTAFSDPIYSVGATNVKLASFVLHNPTDTTSFSKLVFDKDSNAGIDLENLVVKVNGIPFGNPIAVVGDAESAITFTNPTSVTILSGQETKIEVFGNIASTSIVATHASVIDLLWPGLPAVSGQNVIVSTEPVILTAASLTTITVTSPNGGEQWVQGSTHPVTWTSTGNIPNVKIRITYYYTTAGPTYASVIESEVVVPNTGSWNWTIPTNHTYPAGASFEASVVDPNYEYVGDQSNSRFSVAAPIIINNTGPLVTNVAVSKTSLSPSGDLTTITYTAEDSDGVAFITLYFNAPDGTARTSTCYFSTQPKSGTCSDAIHTGTNERFNLAGTYTFSSRGLEALDALDKKSIYYPNGTVANSSNNTHNLNIPTITINAAPISTAPEAQLYPDAATACQKAGANWDGTYCLYKCPAGFVNWGLPPILTGGRGYWFGCAKEEATSPPRNNEGICYSLTGGSGFLCPDRVPVAQSYYSQIASVLKSLIDVLAKFQNR